MRYHPLLPVSLAVLTVLGTLDRSQEADAKNDPDEQTLRKAHIPADGRGLVEFLRQLCGNDEELSHLNQLLRQLGSDQFSQREEGSKKLVAIGPAALPGLRQAQRSSDPEVSRRAKSCVEQIMKGRDPALLRVAVRLLVRRPTDGALRVLFRFLPYAADEELEEDIWFGLDELAKNEPAIDRCVLEASRDVLAKRRAAAGYLLGRRGKPDQRTLARRLLEDPDPWVRLRTAQGLLGANDPAGVPSLLALLGEPDIGIAWQAEELLHWAAGDSAPRDAILGSGSTEARAKCRNAWQDWWIKHGRKLDVTAFDPFHPRPGLALLWNYANTSEEAGRVWLCGCDGKPRWRLETSSAIRDVRWLGNSRLVLAEWPRDEKDPEVDVTERDLKGAIVWRYREIGLPTVCQRLVNGNTFIANRRGEFTEVTRGGSVVYNRSGNADDHILLASDFKKLSHDHVACRVDYADGPVLVEFEPVGGRVLQKISLREKVGEPRAVEMLPGHRFLVVERNGERVVEVNAAGTILWIYALPAPRHAVRLPNGNTLIAADRRVVEVDPAGWMVGEMFTADQPWRVRPCFNLVRLGFDRPRPAPLDLASSIPYRLKGLKSPDPLVRGLSAHYLKWLGPRALPAARGLIENLNDPDVHVWGPAMEALVSIGPDAIPCLLEALKDNRPPVRKLAIWVLGDFEQDGPAIVPALIQALGDKDVSVRRKAAWALGRYGSQGRQAIPALLAALKDPDTVADHTELSVAQAVVIALGNIGPESERVVPTLMEIARSKDRTLSALAISGLGRIGPRDKTIAPFLLKLVQSGRDLQTRTHAASMLPSFGPEAALAVPALIELLKIEDTDRNAQARARETAAQALGQIRAQAKAAVAVLIEALHDQEPRVRAQAAKALGAIGAEAQLAVPALIEAVFDQDRDVQSQARQALERIRS